eukprot:519941-Karenia_brevis.AAC.1
MGHPGSPTKAGAIGDGTMQLSPSCSHLASNLSTTREKATMNIKSARPVPASVPEPGHMTPSTYS